MVRDGANSSTADEQPGIRGSGLRSARPGGKPTGSLSASEPDHCQTPEAWAIGKDAATDSGGKIHQREFDQYVAERRDQQYAKACAQ